MFDFGLKLIEIVLLASSFIELVTLLNITRIKWVFNYLHVTFSVILRLLKSLLYCIEINR